MAKAIEYRVRAVTRYIVTKHDPNRDVTDVVAEVNAQYMANRMAKGLAMERADRDPSEPEPQVFTLDSPPPGRVMRCKVRLNGRAQAYAAAPSDGEGKPPGRYIEKPWSYERGGGTQSGISYLADPADPANIVLDGEALSFGAVCPPSCDPKGAEENLIFGKATPFFDLRTHVRNAEVLAALELGREYYVDFVPARAEAQTGA